MIITWFIIIKNYDLGAHIFHYASFSDPLRELEEVLAVPEQAFDKIGFTDELKKLRKLLLKQQQVREQGLPQNINPMMA